MQLSAKDVIGKTMMTSLAVLVGVVNGINLAVFLRVDKYELREV